MAKEVDRCCQGKRDFSHQLVHGHADAVLASTSKHSELIDTSVGPKATFYPVALHDLRDGGIRTWHCRLRLALPQVPP